MGWPFRVTDPLLDVLEVLMDAEDELHGWEIISHVQRTGATVYQVLERLRKARWVDHRWEDLPAEDEAEGSVARPRRRYYRLSAEGAAKAPVLLRERRPQMGPSSAPGYAFRCGPRWGGAH
jgi:PadR family transcriptional regulator PadR